MSEPDAAERRTGLVYGVSAYLWWGLAPLYFKAVAHVHPLEMLAHRVVWSLPLLLVLLRVMRRFGLARTALAERRVRWTLAATTVLIATNWFVFLWAVITDRITDASLGYFINPLVNVALGRLFLHERLRPLGLVSVALAAFGVAYMAFGLGRLPWISLVLAGSFGAYGLLRKTARVDSLVGLSLEVSVLFPLGLFGVGYWVLSGEGHFGGDWQTSVLLACAGVVTAAPLLWFAGAARRLRLTTLGLLQYLAPSMQLVLAVALFGEPFSTGHAVTFGCIWAALALYSADMLYAARRAGAA